MALGRQALGQARPRLHQTGGHLRLLLRIDGASEPEAIDVGIQVNQVQDFEELPFERVGPIAAGRRIVDPIRLRIEIDIAGLARFRQMPVMLLQRFPVALAIRQGPVLEAVDQIFPHRLRKEVGIRPNIPEAPTRRGLRQFRQSLSADLDGAPGRRDQSRQQKSEMVLAAGGIADHGSGGLERHLEADLIENAVVGLVGQRQARDLEVALERRDLDRGVLLSGGDHVGRLELFDDLVVLDLDVVAGLLPIQQLAHRAGQVLVGSDHGDQGTDVELAVDRQQAAGRVEDERRELTQEVVEKLDEELALKDLESDREDSAETAGQLGSLPIGGVVSMHFDRAVHDLADAPRKLAGGELTFLAETQDRDAQLRNQNGLNRQNGTRHQPQPDRLDHDENHGRDRLTAQEGGSHEGIADETAQRLHLVLDHGGDFRRLHAPQRSQTKPQQTVGQLVTQTPEHALAEPALGSIDHELEAAVDADQREESEAERQQKARLRQLQPFEQQDGLAGHRLTERQMNASEKAGVVDGVETLSLNALIDDLLRQIQGQEIERQG